MHFRRGDDFRLVYVAENTSADGRTRQVNAVPSGPRPARQLQRGDDVLKPLVKHSQATVRDLQAGGHSCGRVGFHKPLCAAGQAPLAADPAAEPGGTGVMAVGWLWVLFLSSDLHRLAQLA